MTKNEALTMCLEYIETNAHERKYVRHAIKQALADIKQDLTPVQKPRLDQGADYERGFIDGMQKQMQSSVDKAVNAMSQPAPVQEPDGYVSSFESNSPLMLGLSEWERKRLIPVYKSPPAAQPAPVQPVAWDVFNGICHHSTHGTESSAKAMAAEMQKNHDLSGSIAAFNVKPRMSTPTAAPVQEPFGYFRYDLRLDAWVQNREGRPGTAFYTSPPAQRKPLTDGLPCCGYTDASAIKWNEFNHAVQCHNCGQTYTQTPNKPLTLEYIDQHIGADEGDREAVVALVREVEAAHGIKE